MHPLRAKGQIPGSFGRCLLDAIDHVHVNGAGCRLQLESELLLNGSENVRPSVGISSLWDVSGGFRDRELYSVEYRLTNEGHPLMEIL